MRICTKRKTQDARQKGTFLVSCSGCLVEQTTKCYSFNMIDYLSLFAFILLAALAAGRGLMLRRRGKNPFVFGRTHKSDFLLVPAVAFFFYAILASVFLLPFPEFLLFSLFSNQILSWIGIIICYASLVWFALTLKTFGESFRIGIDEDTKDKLVTTGTFSLSRNPLYLAMLAFVTGMILIHSNLVACIAMVFFAIMINRQISREEAFLKIHYGSEYEEYCQKVRRFL